MALSIKKRQAAAQWSRRNIAILAVIVLVVIQFGVSNKTLHLYSYETMDEPTRMTATTSNNNGTAMTAETNVITNTTTNTTNTSNLRPHPHMGARFPNGSFGYIADPTMVRRLFFQRYSQNASALGMPITQFLPLDKPNETLKVCQVPPGKGPEKQAWELLTQKIKVNGTLPVNNETNTTMGEQLRYPLPKVFCGIYTYEKKHYLLESAAETWGWRCDGFLGFSTKTIPELGAVDLPHEGEEGYHNMWQKVRSIWAYIHDHYIDDYDYFHLSGDDNHFIIENMKNYLSTLNTEEPLYLGHQFKSRGVIVCGGGAGYTLNKVALKRLIEEVLPQYMPHKVVSSEDAFIGMGLKALHITSCRDTADANGEQRYVGMEPNFLATFNGRRNYFERIYTLWAKNHGWKTKLDLVSSQHIAFHLLRSPLHQKRIHAILYQSCPRGTVVGEYQWNETNQLKLTE